jgi:hypothetical protein
MVIQTVSYDWNLGGQTPSLSSGLDIVLYVDAGVLLRMLYFWEKAAPALLPTTT